jgi:monofunctional biosynthetic peptidoglycan transglycosylase
LFKRIFGIASVLVAAYVAYEWMTFPNVSQLADQWPKTTAFMEQRKAELRAAGKDDTLQYQPVPYSQISPYLRRAVLVSEDNDFYAHNGVDVDALKKAIEKDWERGQITRGGSTITQQLAKNLYLSPSRNPLRKIKEYFIARSLENHLSKKRILELYLNVVEMGERVYGAEAASRAYFHTSASSISPSQAALLAGCLPNPRVMNPASPNKRLRARQSIILSRLRRWGYVVEEQVLTDQAPAEPTETTMTTTEKAGTAPPPTTTTQ